MWVPLASGQVSRADVDDPPRIVFNHSIGDVRLGMSRDEVEYLYRDTNNGRLEILDHYFTQVTKYSGKPLYRMTYPLHGGKLVVSYVDDRVKVVETSSRYYRTPRNIGVGSYIPLGPRHEAQGRGIPVPLEQLLLGRGVRESVARWYTNRLDQPLHDSRSYLHRQDRRSERDLVLLLATRAIG